jgi:hypothetical protein
MYLMGWYERAAMLSGFSLISSRDPLFTGPIDTALTREIVNTSGLNEVEPIAKALGIASFWRI